MKRRKLIALIENGACIAVIGLMLIEFPSSAANAEQPPWGCLTVSKGEYDAAKSKKMLRNKFGRYVRTGRLWQRNYWYCH